MPDWTQQQSAISHSRFLIEAGGPLNKPALFQTQLDTALRLLLVRFARSTKQLGRGSFVSLAVDRSS